MSSKYSLSILVPVYNEEKTLGKVFAKIEKIMKPDYELIIVNDASKDSSLEIINDFIKRHNHMNIVLINHEINKGKGAGIKSAVRVAEGSFFVIQDADLEYEPAEIPPLLELAETRGLKAVYGSRFLGTIEGMATANYYANKFYNFLLRRLYKTKITDMHTCYKLVDTKLLKSLHMEANGFGYAPELISKLLKKGIDVEELPISFKGRTKKEGKKIDLLDGIECVLSLIHYRYGKKTNFLNLNNVRMTSKFMVVGFAGFLTNYLILTMASNYYSKHYSEILAVIISLQVTFVLHDRWTYSHMGKMSNKLHSRYLYFMSTNIVGGFVTALCFSLLVGRISDLASLIIAASLGLIWNYAFNLIVTWRRASS